MLRITQNSAAAGAKSYYTAADYYSEGQELVGIWKGKGARRLGLSGEVHKEDWEALCDNLDPHTGLALTQRQKRERRVGYDFNFHAPKSVSLLYSLTQDERILDAFRESVDETMRDMESEMKTRVRVDGRNENRTTGNLLWGEFVHTTARPVNGVPDPHLHIHAFGFNITFDPVENRWKAGQFKDLKRDAPYFEAAFHSRLARRMEELGLPVRRTKSGWELEGVPEAAIKKFSRRTALIEKEAKDKGIVDPDAKGELGAKTRERKAKDLTLDELREQWRSRLTSDEVMALNDVHDRVSGHVTPKDGKVASEAVACAVEHWFERNSVVPERKVLARALKSSVGAASLEQVTDAFHRFGLVTGTRDGQRFVTTREVLEEERRMIAFAREGRGTCPRLGNPDHSFKREWLNDDQRKAVKHVLTSPDRVMLIRGAAGVGKTKMMQEAVEAIEARGTKVFTFAPSADASRGVLRSDGFADADTVARLLIDKELQSQVQDNVIWIDEASLLGTRTMGQVFDLANKLGSRVVLCGDRYQHGSVERGAALRLLEEEAGVVPTQIREIQRQKDDYKRAVQSLSEGRVADAFGRLDNLGWIKEVPHDKRYKVLADDFVAATADGSTALVVSPTHLEGEWITSEIRQRFQQLGRIGKDGREITTLHNLNLTEAERADPLSYAPGDVVVFHQNGKGFRRGQRVAVGDKPLPLHEAKKFQVFRPGTLLLATGDLIRVTRNGTTPDGHRLNNGGTFTVKEIDASGDIRLTNGWTIDRSYGFLNYGYATTSHASQGKTVDRVLIGQSSASYPASSKEGFYVSVSRARRSAVIYTDDKQALLDAVSRSDDRLSATEFVNVDRSRQRGQTLYRLESLTPKDYDHGERVSERELIHER